ncbi:MAG: extracellular solute-binding protein [Defluviitaleaceae bacterium]|nr:extracellular solute-binding protein [Defluviitaleaceae bacterium]
MTRKLFKKLISFVLIIAILSTNFAFGAEEPSAAHTPDEPITVFQMRERNVISYHNFLDYHSTASRPDREYIIEGASYVYANQMETKTLYDFEGMEGPSVLTGETGIIEWEVYIHEAGLYNLSVLYFPIEGRSSDIQRGIFVNGRLPFNEAGNIEFYRIWVNEGDIYQMDTLGNHIRVRQIEAPKWLEVTSRDFQGYHPRPFLFYLEAGLNTISFVSSREPMVIRHIRLYQEPELLAYEEYLAMHLASGHPIVYGHFERIEAQEAVRKSSPMLYPLNDNSSPAVYPQSPRYILTNTIGGTNWRISGQWIEWDMYVPETGLYNISFSVLQNFARGTSVFRELSINGEVPFQEAEALAFRFQRGWRIETLGNEGDEPFLFLLQQGHNTIRLRVVLGGLSEYVRRVETHMRELNEIYRQLIVLTGTEPDRHRDYQIARRFPHLSSQLTAHSEDLYQIFDELVELSGGRGERDAAIQNMAQQLSVLAVDVESFTFRLDLFRINIGALGTWLIMANEQTLQLDAINIQSTDTAPPRLRNSWWARLWHELQSLFFSFFIDYTAIGSLEINPDQETITVWTGVGRDQANLTKSLIDQGFAGLAGINVNLMLVDMATLLPAILAGQGPDVAMFVSPDIPMNFGIRGALHDISQFPDFDEITSRFHEAAMVPFTYDGRTFGLPESMTFPMLFYRMDILEELGLEVPQTWDELPYVLSVLSVNNLAFGLPAPAMARAATITSTETHDGAFGMFLFQNGGEYYSPCGRYSGLDSEIGIATFRQFTRYYTDFTLERAFDFVNRFRIGEMPLGVVDFTTYNMLQVFAPEIRGMWGFTTVPGTVREDGRIDRSVAAGGSAIVMTERSNYHDASWEFIKWWTSSETQLDFARGLEALLGPSARYPTANLEAFDMLAWPIEHHRQLTAQQAYLRGIPQVPGGYFTARHINNAFNTVVVAETMGPREALTNHVRFINEEIAFRRNEFGLD